MTSNDSKKVRDQHSRACFSSRLRALRSQRCDHMHTAIAPSARLHYVTCAASLRMARPGRMARRIHLGNHTHARELQHRCIVAVRLAIEIATVP